MPNDSVLNHFIDKMGVELLFVIGLLVILAYVAVKSIPAYEELHLERIKSDHSIAEQRLDIDKQREARKAQEAEQEIKIQRDRTEQIASQNVILDSVARTMENLSAQTTTLITTINDSKDRSKSMNATVLDTNSVAHDTNKMIRHINDILK